MLIHICVSPGSNNFWYSVDRKTWSRNPIEVPAMVRRNKTGVLLQYYYNCAPMYRIEPRVELFRPRGFNVTFPAAPYPRLALCDFYGNVNKPIVNHTFDENSTHVHYAMKGAFFRFRILQVTPAYYFWQFVNTNTELKVGDTLYYWLTALVWLPFIGYKVPLEESNTEYALLITEEHMKNRRKISF